MEKPDDFYFIFSRRCTFALVFLVQCAIHLPVNRCKWNATRNCSLHISWKCWRQFCCHTPSLCNSVSVSPTQVHRRKQWWQAMGRRECEVKKKRRRKNGWITNLVQTKRFLCSFLEKLWILCANCWQNSTSNHSILCAPIFGSVVNTFAVSKSSPYHLAHHKDSSNRIFWGWAKARERILTSAAPFTHTPKILFVSFFSSWIEDFPICLHCSFVHFWEFRMNFY